MTEVSYRIEHDFLGSKQIPSDSLYGIHSLRARENFPDQNRFHPEWYQALGTVKKACYLTAQTFFEKLKSRADVEKLQIKKHEDHILESLIISASKIESGLYFDQFIVPTITGGAGTSINMNVNEIIANLALQIENHKPGEYTFIDPIEHANIFQSTNDIVPTSLKVVSIRLLMQLEDSINALRLKIEALEKKHANDLRKGYTQMQEAVPTSFGRLFSTYNDALSRDWWRISKCFERIKVVNLGGSAIGSGITVPRFFIMEVVRTLQEISGLPITRGENLYDATNNVDSLVEVHGILKAHAVNLEKIVSDIRLLASDIVYQKEIEIPKKQVGSSIMPGKVNPVISEFVVSCAHKVYSNDILIASLSAQGCLELNAYLPVIGHALLESIKLLIACNKTATENLFDGLVIHSETAFENLMKSPSVTTALVQYIGYNKAAELAGFMKENSIDIYSANKSLNCIEHQKLERILKPENLLKEGFTLNDLSI
jgi:aspartate ammonia-lyase